MTLGPGHAYKDMAHENTFSMSSGVDLYAPGAGLAQAALGGDHEKKHSSKAHREKKEKKEKKEKAPKE